MAYRHHLPPAKKYRDLPIRDGNFDGIRIRLLNAAWNALHTREADNISLRELADEVGVSQPAAYNHFRDKEELFATVADEALGTLLAQIVELVPEESTSLKGVFRRLCVVWLDFAEARPRHYALMYALRFTDPKRFLAITDRRHKLRLLLEGFANQELGFAPRPPQAQMLLAMLHGAAALAAAGDINLPASVLQDAVEAHLTALRKKHK